MSIRLGFLEIDADFGAVVVHGHTITEEPEVRSNRINIDTGASRHSRLTCLVLEGNQYRFLSASQDRGRRHQSSRPSIFFQRG
jgi:serine/threonine protein phosphatase 1